jgi:hypothetical protein
LAAAVCSDGVFRIECTVICAVTSEEEIQQAPVASLNSWTVRFARSAVMVVRERRSPPLAISHMLQQQHDAGDDL